MGILDWFTSTGKKENSSKRALVKMKNISRNAAYKNYALNVCIIRIANALSLCDFQTYKDGEYIKDRMWWLFNFEPNKNQNQIDFLNKIIYKMVFHDDGALIIQDDSGNLLVADDFNLEKFAFKENVYSNIKVNNYTLQSSKLESEVIHLTLNNQKVKSIVESIYDDYGELISGTIRNYKRGNAIKLALNIDAQFDQFKKIQVINPDTGETTTEYDMILDDMFQNRFKAMFDEKDSITPIEAGLEINEIAKGTGNTKSGSFTTRDITDTFTDIMNFTADAFGIPRGYLKGDVADGEVMKKNFISDVIKPIADQMTVEFNRKLYKFENVRNGTKVKVQTNSMYSYDIVEFANAAEAMYRIGALNTNEIRDKIGEERIRDDWANKYAITKNYTEASNIVEQK